MSTQVGNTTKAFGRNYNITVSNVGGDNILTSSVLRENTIIIDSKIDRNFEDVGTYAMFITDSEGKAVRLTYTIQPGNGLYVDESDHDKLKMRIDGISIMANDGDELYVNKNNIIDNNTLLATSGRIHVQTTNLARATSSSVGVMKGDEDTIKVSGGVARVETKNLQTVDDVQNRDGIMRHSSEMNRTIEAVDGKLNVLTYNLDKADNDTFGVVRTDGVTTMADDNGKLSVITAGLDVAHYAQKGIIMGDGATTVAKNGVMSVLTHNLTPADSDNYGVVMIDGYSLVTSENNGKLEVYRYPEIEALLETNNPEHEIFRRDIEDLKNRVSKLETTHQQEIIDFFIPVGEQTTTLPQPEFDKKTWTVKERYADRKTISFQIKTNCKFNINVEYKENTNDYGQVTLLNVQESSSVTIPANDLANTIFEATGSTVQTINFTFEVKNYDKDNNQSCENTQVIVTATSINDAAIKQTSFHIFKCWNNLAFTEDEPVYDEPDVKIEGESYWVVYPRTAYVSLNDPAKQSQTADLQYGGTTTKNFYFNTWVSAAYTYYNANTGDYFVGQMTGYNQSSGMGDGDYDVAITGMPSWLTASITTSYATTRQFNVLQVKSTTPITVPTRTADIIVKLKKSDAQQKGTPGNTVSESSIDNSTNDLLISTVKEAMNTIRTQVNGRQELNEKIVKNASSTTSLNAKPVNESFTKQKILDDISNFNSRISYFESLNNSVKTDESILRDKTSYETFSSTKKEVELTAKKIIKEYVASQSIITKLNPIVDSNKSKQITFKYTERMNASNAALNVSATISPNESGIKFVVTRNAASYVLSNNWSLTPHYVFVNKNGDVVDASGNNSTKQYSADPIKPGLSTNFTQKYNTAQLEEARTGYDVVETTEYSYYNIVTISASTNDRGSLWGIGSGHKDEGIAYWGSYNPTTNKVLDNITDDIYLVFRLTGQDAKISGQNYSFYSFNIKGKVNGYAEAIEQANEIEFMGLSKTKYTKSKTASYSTKIQIESSKTLYILKNLARTSAPKTCSQSASAEKTLLNTCSREYFTAHQSTLVANYTTKTNQVASSIAGIKLTGITLTPENPFAGGEPSITYSVSGSWNTSSGGSSSGSSSGGSSSGSSSSSGGYTFGGAKITNVTIEPWDDIALTIRFTITGGAGTNIPNGTAIAETTSPTSGTKFTFLQSANTFDSSQFYNYKTVNVSAWSNNMCTVTYKLYNNYSLYETGSMSLEETMYSKSLHKLQRYYTDMTIRYALKNPSRNMTYRAEPYLYGLSGIKVFFALTTKGITVAKRFETSTSSMGVQINIGGGFETGCAQSVSIVNALYNSTTTTSNTTTGGTTSGGANPKGGGGSQSGNWYYSNGVGNTNY